MRQRIMALLGNTPTSKPQAPSPDTVNALRSLGYLSGSTASSRLESRVDAKDRIGDFELYARALALASAGQLAESSSLLQKLGDKLPDVVEYPRQPGTERSAIGALSGAGI